MSVLSLKLAHSSAHPGHAELTTSSLASAYWCIPTVSLHSVSSLKTSWSGIQRLQLTYATWSSVAASPTGVLYLRGIWTGLNGFSLDRYPRLSSIKLNNFSYPSITSLIYLIRQFSFIASLDLDDIRIVPVAGAVPLPPRLPTTQRSHDWSLRTLSLRTSSNHDNPPEQRSLAVGLAKTPCLTNLTSLRLHVSPAACGAWAPSLPASLHHLVISINAIFSTERWHVPLQSLCTSLSTPRHIAHAFADWPLLTVTYRRWYIENV